MSIRIVERPSVYLIGQSAVNRPELARFLEDRGVGGWATDAPSDPEALAEIGGRTCYQSFKRPRPGGNGAYLGHILESGHGSVLEHAVYTLLVAGISRSLSHELVRHRHLSPSQLSQRYVDSGDVAFVVPPAYLSLPADHAAMSEWRGQCEVALEGYRALDEIGESLPAWRDMEDKTARRKAAREAARSVLPNCAETMIVLTGNARAWRNFIDQRARPEADAEIRRLALAVLDVLRGVSPNLFGDYEVGGDPPAATTPYRKV